MLTKLFYAQKHNVFVHPDVLFDTENMSDVYKMTCMVNFVCPYSCFNPELYDTYVTIIDVIGVRVSAQHLFPAPPSLATLNTYDAILHL